MNSVERLRSDHREIESRIARLRGYLARATPPDPIPFLQFRWDFGRILVRHLIREDWLLYPKLRMSPRPEVRHVAERLCSEVGMFERAFAIYAHNWTSLKIAENWEGFRADTTAMIGLLERRMNLEEQQLYPLIADDGARQAGLTASEAIATSA